MLWALDVPECGAILYFIGALAMMFRLSVGAILIVLSIILLKSIFELESKHLIQERIRYIQSFEREHRQKFEFVPNSDLSEDSDWFNKDYYFLIPDPPVYDL